MHVCDGVATGLFAPGDQDQGYLDNPGEGWADAYAHLPENGFADFKFQFNQKFKPTTEEAYAAIRRDVLQPWTTASTHTFTGSLGAKGSKRFTQPLTLDGVVVGKLTGHAGSKFVLQALSEGKALGSSKGGARERLTGPVCGAPSSTAPSPITFRVVRKSGTGSGSFSLKVSYAG